VNSLLQRGEACTDCKRLLSGLAPLTFTIRTEYFAAEVPQEQQAYQGPHAAEHTSLGLVVS
jgi:hypothetical protein